MRAVEFSELIKDDGLGGHVDAEREGFGGEDELDKLGGKKPLDDFFKRREHTRVMESDAPLHKALHFDGAGFMREVEAPGKLFVESCNLFFFFRRQKIEVLVFPGQLLGALSSESKIKAWEFFFYDQAPDEVIGAVGFGSQEFVK